MAAALRTCLTLVALVALLDGCGASNDSKVTGDWFGKFVMTDGKTVPGANLTLDDHHHWRELYRNLDVQGRWRLSGNTIILNVELYDGLLVADAKKLLLSKAAKEKDPAIYKSIADNLDKPMALTVNANGKSLSRVDPGAEGTAIYTRDASTTATPARSPGRQTITVPVHLTPGKTK